MPSGGDHKTGKASHHEKRVDLLAHMRANIPAGITWTAIKPSPSVRCYVCQNEAVWRWDVWDACDDHKIEKRRL